MKLLTAVKSNSVINIRSNSSAYLFKISNTLVSNGNGAVYCGILYRVRVPNRFLLWCCKLIGKEYPKPDKYTKVPLGKCVIKTGNSKFVAKCLLREVDVIQALEKESGFIRFVYDGSTKMVGSNFHITQYFSGGDLLEYYNDNYLTLKFPDILIIFEELIREINILHSKNIAHCDIKLENICLEDPSNIHSIRLIDFGASVRFNGVTEYTCDTFSPSYQAPESIAKKVLVGEEVKYIDYWELGISMYYLLCGRPPFYDATLSRGTSTKLQKSILYSEPKWTVCKSLNVPDSFVDLVKGLLKKEPLKRLDISTLDLDPWKTLVS